MNRMSWILLLLSPLGLTAMAPYLRADHNIKLPERAEDPEALFKQRLQKRHAWADTQEQIQNLLGKSDQETVKRLLENWLKQNPDVDFEDLKSKTLNDPRLRKMAEALVGQQDLKRFGDLNPDERELLQKQLRDLAQSLGQLPPLQHRDRGNEPTPSVPTGPHNDKPRAVPPDAPEPPSADAPSTEPTPPQGGQSGFSDWLARVSDRLKNSNATALGQSAALQQAIRDLGRYNAGMGASGKTTSKLQRQLADLGRYVQSRPLWSQERWKGLGKWSPPIPSLRDLPRPNWRGAGMPALGLPRVTIPRAARPQDGLGLLWIVVVLILGFVLWKVLGRQGWLATADIGPVWKLGPWPVQPDSVNSRGDLIKAFEYLSLLKFGPAARSWNHRQIAAALAAEPAQEGEDRGRAAHQLAGLYEQARYSPGDEPLPPEAFATARRDLSLLAGVPTA